MKKALLFLFLLPSVCSADRLGSLNPNSQVLLSTQSAASSPGGSNTNVQYNNIGSLGGDSGFQYDRSVSSITLGGAFQASSNQTSFIYNDGGKFGNIGNGDPALTLDDETGTPAETIRFIAYGTMVAFWDDETSEFDIGVSTANSTAAVTRIAFPKGNSAISFRDPNAVDKVVFDLLGSSTFSIPVAISTLTVNKQLKDSTLSAGTSGYILTSRGTSAGPQWLPATASGGSGTPGGTPGQIQYNNTGSFGGFGNWDGTGLTVASETVSGNLFSGGNLNISNPGVVLDSTNFNIKIATNSAFITGKVLNITSPQGNGFLNMSPAGEIYFGGSSADLVFADRSNPGISVSLVDYYLDTVYNHFSVANGFNIFSIDQNGRTAIAQSSYDTYTSINPPPAQLYVKDYLSSLPAVIIQGASSQSANLQEWQKSDGTVYADISSSGHLNSKGPVPAVSSCGTSPSVVGSDNGGTITVGSGIVTACTLTFANAYTNAPACVISDNSTAITGDISAISNSAFTSSFSASLGSGQIYYICMGRD